MPWPSSRRRLLHVRGGVSSASISTQTEVWSSPRPWRCFPDDLDEGETLAVFSTSVEVFPRFCIRASSTSGLLHDRGGVSGRRSMRSFRNPSSPRPWRCFRVNRVSGLLGIVFSTSVEVFLGRCGSERRRRRLLHVRGGVRYLSRYFKKFNEESFCLLLI